MTSNSHLVIAATAPFPPDPEFEAAVGEVAPGTVVHWTPYLESVELRTSRGLNGGRNPEQLDEPSIDEETRKVWAEADIVLALDAPSDMALLHPKMRWFQSVSAGFEKFDLQQFEVSGATLTTASGVGSAAIAEFVMARLLQVWKNLRVIEAQQADRIWQEQFGSELTGRTLGVIGLGAIGRQIARRARAFDMTVIATRGSAVRGDHDPDVDELHPADDLHRVISRCDAVVAALPSTPATVDMFESAAFNAMHEGAIFVNVGRGVQVVESDLIHALESGHLAAAALDVVRNEPLPADDPMWAAPNLYLSPHCAVSMDRYALNVVDLFLDNLGRFVRGEPLRNTVDVATQGARP